MENKIDKKNKEEKDEKKIKTSWIYAYHAYNSRLSVKEQEKLEAYYDIVLLHLKTIKGIDTRQDLHNFYLNEKIKLMESLIKSNVNEEHVELVVDKAFLDFSKILSFRDKEI